MFGKISGLFRTEKVNVMANSLADDFTSFVDAVRAQDEEKLKHMTVSRILKCTPSDYLYCRS